MMTEGTANAVIGTETGTVMTGATGKEDTTGTVIDGMTTGGLEDTTEDGDTDENAKRGPVEDARTTCKSTALQRATATTVTEVEPPSVGGMVWALQNEGALPLQTRSRSL